MHAKFQENQKIFVGVIVLYMQFLSNFEIQRTSVHGLLPLVHYFSEFSIFEAVFLESQWQ